MSIEAYSLTFNKSFVVIEIILVFLIDSKYQHLITIQESFTTMHLRKFYYNGSCNFQELRYIKYIFATL